MYQPSRSKHKMVLNTTSDSNTIPWYLVKIHLVPVLAFEPIPPLSTHFLPRLIYCLTTLKGLAIRRISAHGRTWWTLPCLPAQPWFIVVRRTIYACMCVSRIVQVHAQWKLDCKRRSVATRLGTRLFTACFACFLPLPALDKFPVSLFLRPPALSPCVVTPCLRDLGEPPSSSLDLITPCYDSRDRIKNSPY